MNMIESRNIIYHFVEKVYFEQFRDKEEYCPVNYKRDGFIHCTKEPDKLIEVANILASHKRDEFILLAIDSFKVKAEVKYEDAGGGEFFPHIYGLLNMDAVISIHDFLRDKSGKFIFPSEC